MLTKDPGTRSASPVPGIVPEAVVQHDRPARRASASPAGRLLALLRGDKYMVNAYPPEWRDPTSGSRSSRETPPAPVATQSRTDRRAD
jgi:hypothetical protein